MDENAFQNRGKREEKDRVGRILDGMKTNAEVLSRLAAGLDSPFLSVPERCVMDVEEKEDSFLDLLKQDARTGEAQRIEELEQILGDRDREIVFLRRLVTEKDAEIHARMEERRGEEECVWSVRQVGGLRRGAERVRREVASLGEGVLLLEKVCAAEEHLLLSLHKKQEERTRRLFLEVLDLKGRIRVLCRVKPCPAPLSLAMDDTTLSLRGEKAERTSTFSFSRVFSPSSTQAAVFEEVEDLVVSVLSGYNACIMAYGPTGSGKTHTMEGTREAGGILPRSIETVWGEMRKMERRGWAFSVDVWMVEIYNEEVVDLLGAKGEGPGKTKISIVHDQGETRLEGARKVKVSTKEDVALLLQRGSERRRTGETLCNERSSRSHLVFSLRVEGKREGELCEKVKGELTLVDLAGSERLKLSHAEGERLRETANINKSLSSLGDVISAVLREERHVPYRNSKLTYLLKNKLGGGNSRTAIVVNVDSREESAGETLCTLRFAEKLQSCSIGRAKSNRIVESEAFISSRPQQ